MTVETAALPDLSSDYPLADSDVDQYRSQGHVLLRGLASPEEIAPYRAAILDFVARRSANVHPLEERDTYGKAFLQVGNIWTQDDVVSRFVLARRFAKAAADLMGVDGVRIYHDQALFKEAGGGLTPWHQDQQYWPLDGVKTVTLWMPLVAAGEEMGTLNFASGSHRLGDLGVIPISDTSEVEFSQFVVERGFPISRAKAMAAGDATFHSGWTLHGAPGNSSDSMREVMTIIYFEDGARISEPRSESQRHDMLGCFPGLGPGDIAATSINPLVFERPR